MVFDAFNKKDFEKKIILSILPMDNIEKITPGDSVLEPGLQFVDNICGAIRLSKLKKDEWGFFDIIEKIVKEKIKTIKGMHKEYPANISDDKNQEKDLTQKSKESIIGRKTTKNEINTQNEQPKNIYSKTENISNPEDDKQLNVTIKTVSKLTEKTENFDLVKPYYMKWKESAVESDKTTITQTSQNNILFNLRSKKKNVDGTNDLKDTENSLQENKSKNVDKNMEKSLHEKNIVNGEKQQKELKKLILRQFADIYLMMYPRFNYSNATKEELDEWNSVLVFAKTTHAVRKFRVRSFKTFLKKYTYLFSKRIYLKLILFLVNL